MRFVFQAALVLGMSLLVGLSLVAAQAQAPVASDAEKQELAAAVQEASTSGFDMIRALEAHLRKYPNTPLRRDMLPLLAKAAVDAHKRTVRSCNRANNEITLDEGQRIVALFR